MALAPSINRFSVSRVRGIVGLNPRCAHVRDRARAVYAIALPTIVFLSLRMSLNRISNFKFRPPRNGVKQDIDHESGEFRQPQKEKDGEGVAKFAKIKKLEVVGFAGKVLGSKFLSNKLLADQLGFPKGQKFLKKICISLPKCRNITQAQIKEIAEFLRKNAGSLTDLELDFSGIKSPLGVTLKPIFEEIKDISRLEKFGMNLADSNLACGDRAISDIAKALRHLKNLHSLELNFSGVCPHKRVSLKPMFDALKNKYRLSDFILELARSKLAGDAQAIADIAGGLRHLNELHRLALNFSGICSDERVPLRPVSEALKKMPRLGDFILNLARSNLVGDDQAITDIAEGLGNLDKLHSLEMNFSGVSSDNHISLGPLADSLQGLSLHSFKINLAGTGEIFGAKAITDIARLLRSKKNLQCLKINLHGVRDSGESLIRPILEYLKSTNNIKELELNLNQTYYSQVDQTLIDLAEALRCQNNLNNFTLGVAGSRFGVDALNNFIFSLKYLDKLKNFSLNLAHSIHLGSVDRRACLMTCKNLWNNLSQLKFLRTMAINVAQNYGVDDDAVFGLRALMGDIEALEEITLLISETQCKTQSIQNFLEGLRQGQILRVDARCCMGMDDDKVRELIENFEMKSQARAEVYLENDSDYKKAAFHQTSRH